MRSVTVKYKSSDMLDYFFFWKINREEKSLRHVTTVAKFLDDNKPKTSLKNWIRTVSNFNDLTQFHSICKISVKLSGVESKRITNSIKRARQIRKFHVADLQWWLRNIQKSVMYGQSCCFADINRLPFCRSRCRRRLCRCSPPLLWCRNVATIVMRHHPSPFYSGLFRGLAHIICTKKAALTRPSDNEMKLIFFSPCLCSHFQSLVCLCLEERPQRPQCYMVSPEIDRGTLKCFQLPFGQRMIAPNQSLLYQKTCTQRWTWLSWNSATSRCYTQPMHPCRPASCSKILQILSLCSKLQFKACIEQG